jgi:hypothetical protein
MPVLNLKSGTRVKLHGLVKTPEHNDMCGVVVREEGMLPPRHTASVLPAS